jgi:hypothetical protein
MAFSVIVEMLNLRLRAKTEPVHLREERINEDVARALERRRQRCDRRAGATGAPAWFSICCGLCDAR